jgi:hypothetical protein
MSSTWTTAELDSIAASEELRITGERADGTLYRWTPIWVVRVDQDLYVRSGGGPKGGWYRHATAGPAHIRVNCHDHTVTLEPHADQAIVHAVDNAYETKYRTSPFLGALLSNAARSTTTRLLPSK